MITTLNRARKQSGKKGKVKESPEQIKTGNEAAGKEERRRSDCSEEP